MSTANEDMAPPQGRIVTETRDHVRLIGIDRPQKYNGFTPEMIQALAEAYQAYEDDDQAWCALLWAQGEHFTAGLQLDRFDITDNLGIDGKRCSAGSWPTAARPFGWSSARAGVTP